MNDLPKYKILEQWDVNLNGHHHVVSRLRGGKYHCTCSRCNSGFCDDDCLHVTKALAFGSERDVFLTVLDETVRKSSKAAARTNRASRCRA